MTAPEKRIAKDYLWRKRWYYGIGFVVHVLLAWAAFSVKDAPVTPVGIIGGSAFVLLFDMIRGGGTGTGRTLLSLPVTVRQIAAVWRYVAIVFPAVVFLGALVAGFVLSFFSGGNRPSPELFVILAVLQTLVLGVIFFALTGLPAQPQSSSGFLAKTKEIFSGLLWGFSIPGFVFMFQYVPKTFGEITPAHGIVAALLGLAGVAGWTQADVLARRRSERMGSGKVRRKDGKQQASADWKKFGAMRFMMIRYGLFVLFFMGLMVVFMTVSLAIFRGGREPWQLPNLSQLGTFVMVVALICFLQMMSQLRILRTLPVSRTRLAGWLVVWPFLLTIAANLYAQGIHIVFFGGSFDYPSLCLGTLGASLLVLGVPVVALFCGANLFLLALTILFAGLTQAVPEIAQQFGLNVGQHSPILWIVSGVIVLIAWFLTGQGLKSSKPWREGALKLPAMARRG